MLHKLFNYLGAGLLAIAASQCKCAKKPIYDIANLELKWEEEGHPLEVSGLDLEHADGIICYMPSEEAVYFWNHDGKCCKFTIPLEGGLACESIADLNPDRIYPRFAFAAGSKEKQVLYGGVTDSWGYITIWKYESGGWNPVSLTKSKVSDFLPVTYNFSRLSTTCTFETGSQLCGCFMLELIKRKPSSYEYKSGFLVFDPTTQNFSVLQTMMPTQPSKMFTTAVRLAQGSILVGEKQHGAPASLSILSISNDSLALRQTTNSIIADRWESFLLRAEGELPISEPIFTTYKKDDIPKFYKLDELNQVVSAGSLSIESVGNSLVLPFSSVVYVVTTVKENGEKKTVSYKGMLEYPPKKPDKKS